jgi:hypothetical protein
MTTLLLLPALAACGARAGLDDGGRADGCAARTSDAWSLSLEASADGEQHAVALDPQGNIVLFADFRGSIDLGCGVVATGDGDAPRLLAKLDPHGNLLWQRTWRGVTGGAAAHLGVDGAGRVYLEDDGSPPTQPGDTVMSGGYLASFDTSGERRWLTALPATKSAQVEFEVTAFAVSDVGSVLVGANFDGGTIDFGDGPLTNVAAEYGAMCFATFDDAGRVRASFTRDDVNGNALSGSVAGVAFATDGDLLLLSGGRGGPFSGSPRTLSRRAPDGAVRWSRPVDDAWYLLAASGDRYLMVGGGDGDGAGEDVGGVTEGSLGDGGAAWSVVPGASSAGCSSLHPCQLQATVIGMRTDGSALIAGALLGGIDVGGQPLVARGYDALLVSIDPTGKLAPRLFGDAATQYFDSVALDASGHAIVTGLTTGDVDLGSSGVVEAGCAKCSRGFVARLDP